MHDAQKPETTATTDFQRPNVIFQLKTREGVQDSINLIVDAMRPTHGPLPRTVAPTRNGSKDSSHKMPDSRGTIKWRFIPLQGRKMNMGAMFIPYMPWELQEKVGDGTATAAVMFQSIYKLS